MADNGHLVYIIILNYNNYPCSDFCLDSLRKVIDSNLKIVLVDNGSTDGSYEKLMEKYPECIGLRNHENLGFARGVNVGLQFAYQEGAHFFLLLNNDVEVTPSFLSCMLACLRSYNLKCIVTPKIYYRQDRQLIWHAGGHINTRTVTAIARGYDERDFGQYNEQMPTRWASGACCLFARNLVDTIGWLEERYFLGQEEWDYSTRALQAGFSIIYEPQAIVYHEIAQSSWKSPGLYAYQMVYNKVLYANKFLSNISFMWFITRYIMYILLYFPRKDLHNLSNSSLFYLKAAKRAALLGVLDYFRNVYITFNHLEKMDRKLYHKYRKALASQNA